jgi:hypothetical protein
MNDKQPIASTIPQEGATGWADTTMLHADAKHPNCAYKWMDWSLQPKVQGDVAAWFGSLPAVPAACKGSELLGAEGVQPTASTSSTRSPSGKPHRPRAASSCRTAAGPRITSRSWAGVKPFREQLDRASPGPRWKRAELRGCSALDLRAIRNIRHPHVALSRMRAPS